MTCIVKMFSELKNMKLAKGWKIGGLVGIEPTTRVSLLEHQNHNQGIFLGGEDGYISIVV
jgi:hypothetical protein